MHAGMKVCIDCLEPKPLLDFYRRSGRPGHLSSCRDCFKRRRMERYRENIEVESARRTQWFVEHREHSTNGRHSRRGGGHVSDPDLASVMAAAECLACGSSERLSIEHLIPLSRGGRHSLGNLAVLCRRCNSSKGSDTWTEWKYGKKPRARLVFG